MQYTHSMQSAMLVKNVLDKSDINKIQMVLLTSFNDAIRSQLWCSLFMGALATGGGGDFLGEASWVDS